MNAALYRRQSPAPSGLQSWLLAVIGLVFLFGGLAAELGK